MKKHLNLISILAIFIIPVVLFYILKNPSEDFSKAAIASTSMPTILKFSSPMCYECKQLDKVIKPLEKKYKGKIIVRKLNTGSSSTSVQSLVKKHRVNVVPTLVFLNKNGQVIKKTVGSMSSSKLDSIMQGLTK